jgi:hypothetical protein
VVNATPLPIYPRKKDPLHIVRGAGWTTGPVWSGGENLASTGMYEIYLTHFELYLFRAVLTTVLHKYMLAFLEGMLMAAP